VDISELAIGDSLHVYDLEAEYEIKTPQNQTLVTVVAPQIEAAPTAEEEEVAEEEELAEEEMGEEGEALEEGEASAEGEEGFEE
jgi:large subunit ribosomal protein L25